MSFDPSALTVSNLSVQRGPNWVIADLSISHHSGSFLQLLGPNGSGKSTLLGALAGLLPYAGTIDWSLDGVDLSEHPIATHIHFLSHLNANRPELTARETLDFWAKVNGGSPDRTPDALQASGLAPLTDIRASNMSKGQQRRLALARLLVADRPIWLLDEPTSALDKQGDQWVAGLIAEHLRKGGFCIAATHRPIELVGAVPVAYLMLGGQTKEQDT